MPRGLEHYICSSEDRCHYDNTCAYDYYYCPPMPPKPNLIVSPIVNIESNISEEEIKQLINSRLQELKQNIVDASDVIKGE